MTHKELERLLKKNGCRFHHHGANHDIWCNTKTGEQFPVPRHGKQEVKKGTAESILRQAGLK